MSIPIKTSNLNQTAVLWMAGAQGFDGAYTYASPVEIACRWEDKIEIIKNNEGREIVSSARVFVDREITHDSYLYLGSLASVSGSHPYDVNGAYLVLITQDVSNLRGTERLLSVRL